ncbi:MAG: Fe-S cluster assembly protein SufD [Bradyrhizobiaceae bacterium]|nr:Fe-S cluster assembly protein SufD [Bradyrhizobiaceae bacterium]
MNADIRPIRTAAEQALATAYEDTKSRLPGGPEIARLRDRAFSAFADSGLPTRRVEEWKYTDLRTLLREAAPLAGPPDAGAIARAKETVSLPVPNLRQITLVNGSFVPELSDLGDLEKKLTILPLARALAEKHPLAGMIGKLRPETHNATLALNTAFLNDGVLIEVGEGAVLERPIYLRHVFAGGTVAAAFARSLVVLGRAAAATLVESFEGPAEVAYQRNAVTELHVADRANLSFVRLQAEGESALHISSLLTEIAGGAELSFAALTLGAAVSRQNVSLHLAGEHTQINLAGATLLRGRQHADNTLVLDHAVPNCTSRVTFRSVLDDTSRGVVQGRIVVRPDAQKTDARMSLGSLLLAEGAEADQKPELEIFADDVQCAHGATSGALDEQLLFYLLARGIPRKQAEALLIQAFFGAALEQVRHEGLREALIDRAGKWLELRERAS